MADVNQRCKYTWGAKFKAISLAFMVYSTTHSLVFYQNVDIKYFPSFTAHIICKSSPGLTSNMTNLDLFLLLVLQVTGKIPSVH